MSDDELDAVGRLLALRQVEREPVPEALYEGMAVAATVYLEFDGVPVKCTDLVRIGDTVHWDVTYGTHTVCLKLKLGSLVVERVKRAA